jgi:hypothetical protein
MMLGAQCTKNAQTLDQPCLWAHALSKQTLAVSQWRTQTQLVPVHGHVPALRWTTRMLVCPAACELPRLCLRLLLVVLHSVDAACMAPGQPPLQASSINVRVCCFAPMQHRQCTCCTSRWGFSALWLLSSA